ncbi:uncharacterized protein LOC129966632 [Argiope bruennichi]|uniref:uncharacterized protein LOC129966632 n=1 Tax=Argiope bruennichi TaxID=94029 RepID=UPI0024947F89|nr:uncharacterized protein LOC129966632 [Argiope bruennichi]
MEVEKHSALGMDFKNLISCIHYHEDSQDKDVILETLKTIIDICSIESCGRDAFREEGGLDFLVEFLFSTDNTIFLEHALKTLAFVIDENVHSQMYMSKRSVFEVLQTILKKQSFPTAVQKNALVLISTILYHNSTAQNLVFEIGFLQDLLSLYEYYAQGAMINNSCMTSNLDNSVLNLWMSTNSALCFAVNNPQNEKNQDLCKNIFPIALKILELSSNSVVKNSSASFLLLTISDNAKCQDYFSVCDGFLVLKRCFQKYFDTLLLDMKICNGVTGKETYQAINNIIGIISSASLDHEENATISGEIGILSMMIKLLFLETFDFQLKTKIVLCLGHCIGACCSNKSYVLETENFDAFLKRCLQLGNAELSSACKYLLQVCLMNKELLDSNLDYTRCDPEYYNDALMNNFVSNGMQSSTKVPSIQSPSLKVKSSSRSLEKANSSSSSIYESTSQTICRKRKVPHISERSLNKLSIKKESLSDSKTVQCDLLSDQLFSSKNKKYSNSFHSNATLDSSKYKSCKKEMNQISPSDGKFIKQDVISNKKSFTDFLTNENKSSTTKFKNQSFRKTNNSKISSNNAITDWHMHITRKLNESVNLSTNNPTKTESISPDNNGSSFLPYSMKLANQNSQQEKCPKLFKKKRRISSKKSPSIFSGSSSEYSFTPFNVKNSKRPENESGSWFGYYKPCQSEINFPETSKNSGTINDNYQNNFLKCNLNDKLEASARKPSFSSNAEKQVIKDRLSEFSFKLSPTTFKSEIEKNSFSRGKKMPKTDKENILDLTTFTNSSFQHEKRLMDSGFSSSHFSQHSRRSNMYLNDCYQSSNWTDFPQTSRIFENPYERKHSWSCSSTGTYSESFSPFNSNRYVQVIVLPKKTCVQHGLSSSVELMEVISLEDITQC